MLSIKPIDGFIVNQLFSEEVIAPAYDGFTPAERRKFAENNQYNYINTVRYIDEFSASENMSLDRLLESNKEALENLLKSDKYVSANNALFVYQLEAKDGHIQTGILTNLPFSDYESGDIKIHEFTRKDKEEGLAKYIEKVGVVSSPVCISYPGHSSIDDVIATVMNNQPDLLSETDITQRLWVITDNEIIDELSFYFNQVQTGYLADGHHRLAAGCHYADLCKSSNAEHTGNEDYNYMLAVLFPDVEMKILAYNRCVSDLNNLDRKTFLRLLEEDFEVISGLNKLEAQPMNRHEFGMLLKDKWFKLMAKPKIISDDPVSVLAVSILQNNILSPILDITDPQRDARLEYIDGDSGLAGMENRIAAGFSVAFSCFPTTINEMMDVADVGRVMPPKSTWFTPKVRSGLVVSRR